jgi:hypothetical protein
LRMPSESYVLRPHKPPVPNGFRGWKGNLISLTCTQARQNAPWNYTTGWWRSIFSAPLPLGRFRSRFCCFAQDGAIQGLGESMGIPRILARARLTRSVPSHDRRRFRVRLSKRSAVSIRRSPRANWRCACVKLAAHAGLAPSATRSALRFGVSRLAFPYSMQ